MEALSILFWFIVLSPLLPFVALVGTGLTIILLRVIATIGYEYV